MDRETARSMVSFFVEMFCFVMMFAITIGLIAGTFYGVWALIHWMR